LLEETHSGEEGVSPNYVWLVNWGGLEGAPELLTKDAMAKLRGLGATVHGTVYATVAQSTP
jgi:hypothetical protein